MRSSSPTADRPLSARTSAIVAAILGGPLQLEHRAARGRARRVGDDVARAENAQDEAPERSAAYVGREHPGKEARRLLRRQLGGPDGLPPAADGDHAFARGTE